MVKKTNQTTLKIISIFVLMFTTATTSVVLGYLIGIDNVKEVEVGSEKYPEELKDFLKAYNYVIDNYYEEVDKELIVKGAIEGMIESLGDDFSNYLNVEENENFQLQVKGTYQGIGVSLSNTEDVRIMITSIFEGSPADKAGLKALDQIIKIDGIDYVGKKSTDVVDYIRKSDRQNFVVKVLREGKELDFNIKKEVVTIKSVTKKIIEQNNKKIGYLYINIFALNTYEQFKTELASLEAANIDGLVIDLRGNSGGYLSAVKDMVSLFLDKSKVVYKTETRGKTEVVYSTGNKMKTYPIVMLGDNGSASASEIMIAALTESYGAKFVGVTTYGKGTVQELVDVSGSEAYKFTVKKWLTPNGNWINKTGIVPTYEEKMSENYYKTYDSKDDNQLQKALELLK